MGKGFRLTAAEVNDRGAALRAQLWQLMPVLFGPQDPPTVNVSYRPGEYAERAIDRARAARITLTMPLDDAGRLVCELLELAGQRAKARGSAACEQCLLDNVRQYLAFPTVCAHRTSAREEELDATMPGELDRLRQVVAAVERLLAGGPGGYTSRTVKVMDLHQAMNAAARVRAVDAIAEQVNAGLIDCAGCLAEHHQVAAAVAHTCRGDATG